VTVNKVTGLQEQPDRKYRGDGTVGQQHEGPENDDVREWPGEFKTRNQGRDINGPVIGAQINRCVDNCQGNQRGNEQFRVLFVDHQADDNGDGHGDPDGDHRFRIERKNDGDDQSENRKDDSQSQQQNQQKQDAGTWCDKPAGNFADGLSAIAQRDDQRAEIVDGTDENRTHQNPDERGQPAPEDSDGRTDDGAGSGDAGEVVAEDDFLFGRYKINIIPQLFTGNFRVAIDVKDFLGQPLPIGVVGDDVTYKSSRGNQLY